MKSVTLYKVGGHITDVSVQYTGEIAIASGGSGGEHYLRIQPDAKPSLLSALEKEIKIDAKQLSSEADDKILMLLNALFSIYEEDPYEKIRGFLNRYGVDFKSEYWPSR